MRSLTCILGAVVLAELGMFLSVDRPILADEKPLQKSKRAWYAR